MSTYNKIDTSKEDVINVFNNFSNSIHIVQNKNKTIKGNFIEKVEKELKEDFFMLQNLLTCNSKSVVDIFQKSCKFIITAVKITKDVCRHLFSVKVQLS